MADLASPEHDQQQCDDLGITIWKQPVPPVRRPRRTQEGKLVLDFPSEPERQRFKQVCIHKVSSNCQTAARGACSLKAIDHCRGPNWLRWLGWKSNKPWCEVEACEEEYQEACMQSSTKACQEHAKSFCELVVAKPEEQQPAGGK